MATAAKDRGYRYLAITDHTKGLKIACGLSEERLFDQGKEIQAALQRLRWSVKLEKRKHSVLLGR